MVVKMAKMMKSRRLRKRVRKTLGALFLASAIAVAAIPVDDLQASTGTSGKLGVTLTEADSTIPKIKTDEHIYATGDGVYQFAYVNPTSGAGGNKVAVILGYNSSGHTLPNGKLTIPDTVNVYDKFTDVQGSSDGYVAVGQRLNFLFWKHVVHEKDPATGKPLYEQKTESLPHYKLLDGTKVLKSEYDKNPSAYGTRETEKVQATIKDEHGIDQPQYDEQGNPIMVDKTDPQGNVVYVVVNEDVTSDDLDKPITRTEFLPCYYDTKNTEVGWGSLDFDEFYTRIDDTKYDKSDASNFKLTTDSLDQWITNVAVEYIGNQALHIDEATKKITVSDWITAADVEAGKVKGVFQGQGNIVDLVVGPNLKGIGDYAFCSCTGLTSITLGNGLEIIGNHAFDSCLNIKQIIVDPNCNMRRIGDHAFYNCQSLAAFQMPTPVEAIGDGAFENCQKLATIELYSPDRVTALNTIGDHAFKNCISLTSLVIPNNVTGNSNYDGGKPGDKLKLSMVQGCKNLQTIKVINENADFIADGAYDFEAFKAEMPETFYFEGVNTATSSNVARQDTLHRTANDNSIAFKYLDQNVYEIVKPDPDNPDKKAIFRVNSNNELIYCYIENGMENIILPSTIGPYRITTISSTSFQHNCFLKKITIPSSVLTIADGAFLGCHKLTDVIFESPVQCKIGANAFKTQEAAVHQAGCDGSLLTGKDLKLTFTGDISYASGPFDYAMNPSNNINIGSQERTYITYYSGWPTNLTVKYNEDTDKNELIDYPIFENLDQNTWLDQFPYMTDEMKEAAKNAKTNFGSSADLTDYEREIINSALNIQLPQGIESVKKDLFIENESKETKNGLEKTITTNGIKEILPETFKGCLNLKELYIFGDTSTIGDYAFRDCVNLEKVEISANVNAMGVRPFAGCPNVSYVSFQDGPNFRCEESIIYGLNGGEKGMLIECLESRGVKSGSTSVKAGELAGVTGIAKEAFYDCFGIGIVDLRESAIDKVPEYSFAASEMAKSNMFAVYLPKTCKQIQKNAFKNSAVSSLEIPGSVSYIDLDAFNTDKNSPHTETEEDDGIARGKYKTIEFYCEPDSAANIYASNHGNINISDKPIELEFKVSFGVLNPISGEQQLLETQTVKGGEDAVPPTPPEFEGYTFLGWFPDYRGVSRDLDCLGSYKANNPEDSKLTVTFMDEDGVTVLGTDRVFPGQDAKPPVVPEKPGKRFVGWAPPCTNIEKDTICIAKYDKVDTDENKFTVNFYVTGDDGKDVLISSQRIAPGEKATEPRVPERSGWRFTGWKPDVTEITKDTDTYAQYVPVGPGWPTPTPDPNATPNPNATPTPVPGATATPNPNATASPSPSPVPGIFTLTVRNGSGSGSYVVGAQVIVIADNPSNNSEFSGWTVEPSTAVVASKSSMGTVLIMPASNVTMTANYKSKTNTGNTGTVTRPGGSTGNGTGTGNGSGSSTGSSNGTTVVINKNGLSNTGVVSVTVNGSSDNFVVKISEDANATEAALKALMNEYGDLTNISYFPMDISLYDSTGTNKITDTTGLAVDITLPIPDSLIPYAGNNKVASVVDGRLEKLTPKFTTISGVPCISFTATHFSPYVIYVDTKDLSAGTIQDSTPKTGDGIHPKWFLAMGLACISFILFIKKEKNGVPVKAAAAR